ncbi:hypothetical protein BRLA_c015120 [Brevibacillus laterosporus LMG 15441]|uniref:Uncharacterized protein n=1 Tax=Brevibacillus laterosporus LMG 15441 TaxID=1042163 RepID=A0A075R8G4_BRELA|nr:hypothetical protein BRLA_c015120 [Brevibacillus laterosporus LMG 15441]
MVNLLENEDKLKTSCANCYETIASMAFSLHTKTNFVKEECTCLQNAACGHYQLLLSYLFQ